MPHQYRIFHQYRELTNLKKTLKPAECVLQVDFSENFACKANTESQSMHFGAGRGQVSIHSAHATFLNEERKLVTKCFGTLSGDTRHGPSGIWAHLHPVLKEIRQLGIEVLHILSDGPTP
ncbi:hypothetical protein SNE40_001544 [Patella caerulea]|uniref:Uncharacterized protein n=1 Tax=Patella caerulea TaxID=87958 RepID=A0AAN8KNZ6_PATCE